MKTNLTLLLLIISFSSFSQSQEIDNLIQNIKSNIMEVEAAKEVYKQSLESPSTAVVKYMYDEVDQKGEIDSYGFEFNLADLDPYTIREETKNDIIYVMATVNNKQKLIKTYKNGEIGNYDDELAIISKNVDNARVIIEDIKKAIPLAKKYTESKLNVNTYDEMISWLTANVTEVRLGDVTFKQNIKKGSYPGSLTFSKIEVDAKSNKNEEFIFNLADINPNSVQYDISGNEFGVGFESLRKQKIFNYSEDGAPSGFDDEVVIVTEGVEEARDLKTVLSLAVKEADPLVQKSMSSLGDKHLQLSSSFIKEIKYGDETVSQSFEPSCITNITITEQDPKKTEKHGYKVHLIDLNENSLVYDVSSNKMYLDLLIKNKNKLIKVSEDDQFDGYADDMKVYVENVEIARRAQYALKKAIDLCRAEFKKPFEEKYDNVASWLFGSVGEFDVDGTTYKQSLEYVEEGNKDKFRLTKTEIDAKGGEEEVFELNFSDINPHTINYQIKGKVLAVEFETNFKDKIIKYYKDGEIKNYLYGMEIVYDDIEKARNAISAINYLAEQNQD